MSSHRATFGMCEVIAPRNVYLDDNSVIQAIKMGSIIVEAIVRDIINQICMKDAST